MTGRYWVKLHWESKDCHCSLYSRPTVEPEDVPWAFGFATWESAQDAQRVYLTRPMTEWVEFLRGLVPAVEAGEVVVHAPEGFLQFGFPMLLDYWEHLLSERAS